MLWNKRSQAKVVFQVQDNFTAQLFERGALRNAWWNAVCGYINGELIAKNRTLLLAYMSSVDKNLHKRSSNFFHRTRMVPAWTRTRMHRWCAPAGCLLQFVHSWRRRRGGGHAHAQWGGCTIAAVSSVSARSASYQLTAGWWSIPAGVLWVTSVTR